MSESTQLPKWLEYFSSLIWGYTLIGGLLLGSHELFGPFHPFVYLIVGLLLVAIWTVVWFRFQISPPKNRTDKFGIGLYIITEDEKMRARLENDLVKSLEDIIADQQLGNLFNLVVATNDQAKKFSHFLTQYRNAIVPIREQDPSGPVPREILRPFVKFQQRTKCHFFIWGTLTERRDADLAGEIAYTLNTDAIVVHSALAPYQQKILSKQFLHWLKEIKIDHKAEYQGLRFGASEVFVMAKMIIGTAAAMVGNVTVGYSLHAPILDFLKEDDPNPHHQSVRSHLIRMVVDECDYLAKVNYAEGEVARAKEFIQRIQQLSPNHYGALLLQSIIEYQIDNDPKKALVTINRAKTRSNGDGTWRYNCAFLEMVLGDYKKAYQIYEEVAKTQFEDEDYPLNQVIDFNSHQAKCGFLPSYFILGFLFYNKIGNLPAALENIETFIQAARLRQEFKFLLEKAEEMRKAIIEEMGLKSANSNSKPNPA